MRNIFLLFTISLALGCTVSKQTSTLHPFQGDSAGCGDFIVYKFSDDGKQYISVSVNAGELEFEDSYVVVDAQSVEVKWRGFDGDIRSSICNDVMGDRPEMTIDQTARKGTVSIKVSDKESGKKDRREAYKVTVILKDIVFDGLSVDYLHMENVVVGWLPG